MARARHSVKLTDRIKYPSHYGLKPLIYFTWAVISQWKVTAVSGQIDSPPSELHRWAVRRSGWIHSRLSRYRDVDSIGSHHSEGSTRGTDQGSSARHQLVLRLRLSKRRIVAILKFTCQTTTADTKHHVQNIVLKKLLGTFSCQVISHNIQA